MISETSFPGTSHQLEPLSQNFDRWQVPPKGQDRSLGHGRRATISEGLDPIEGRLWVGDCLPVATPLMRVAIFSS